MECKLVVPHGTDISKIEQEYPDLYVDDTGTDGEDVYFIGSPDDEDDRDSQWMEHDEVIAFCGFCEGAIADAETLIEGNGGWAQGMLSREDFSGLAVDSKTRKEYKRRSKIWHEAFEQGKASQIPNK